MLKTDDIKQIINLAKDGDVSTINLLIGDISAKPLPGLPMNATASLFSNAKANAAREDIAMGLIWMVLQSIGSATILSSDVYKRQMVSSGFRFSAPTQRYFMSRGNCLAIAVFWNRCV